MILKRVNHLSSRNNAPIQFVRDAGSWLELAVFFVLPCQWRWRLYWRRRSNYTMRELRGMNAEDQRRIIWDACFYREDAVGY